MALTRYHGISQDRIYTLGWQWYVSKVTGPVADADNHWIAATTRGADDEATYEPNGKRVAGEGRTTS